MSLSEHISESFAGYRTKPSKIIFPQQGGLQAGAIEQLRDNFARRAEISGRDGLLSTLNNHINTGGNPQDAIVANLTRSERKIARRLGFEVSHAG